MGTLDRRLHDQQRGSIERGGVNHRMPQNGALRNGSPPEKGENPRHHYKRSKSFHRWSFHFINKDPRHQLLRYFKNLAARGDAAASQDHTDDLDFSSSGHHDTSMSLHSSVHSTGVNSSVHFAAPVFNKAAVFAIFRPTSRESIRKMMMGEAVGKGLDIKGKSAKTGKLSALVPFMQIYEEADKKKARWPPHEGRIRLFYSTEASREVVRKYLEKVGDEMVGAVVRAQRILDNEDAYEEDIQIGAMEKMIWEVEDPLIYPLDDYAPDYWGIDVPERFFFEGCINRQDISRPPGSPYETGRVSAPPFQDMNFHATRDYNGEGPRPVVYQTESDPSLALQPQSLVMAYEEDDRVLPVASDFDCFVIGTRRIAYDKPLPSMQIELLHWLLDSIEHILDNPSSDGWTHRWFEVLKKASLAGFHPHIPRFGFGDPKSYSIVEGAVSRLHNNGGIRHGAECFNYYFPQELDEEFFVISELFLDKKWAYIKLEEVLQILHEQVLEGFAFPLNPKWILCDPGWYKIYDAMLQSTNPTIIEALDVWFPVKEGIRAKIARIHKKHPNGFVQLEKTQAQKAAEALNPKMLVEGTEAMDLANLELDRFLLKKRAKLKLKSALMFRVRRTLSQRKAAAARDEEARKEAERRERFLAQEQAVRKDKMLVQVRKSFAKLPQEDMDDDNKSYASHYFDGQLVDDDDDTHEYERRYSFEIGELVEL